jgi:diacylglycerol kinase family enzyme
MALAAQPVWLVINESSGSNEPARLANLRAGLQAVGFPIVGESHFPDEGLPDIGQLDLRSIRLVAIFAGDGSVNALASHLSGWDGAMLVLPGGTMNLLAGRLHGDVDENEIIARLPAPEARIIRPKVVETPCGPGLADVLVGPGASWSEVREAIRDVDIAALAEGTAHAIGETAAGPRVSCKMPAIGRSEGYPLIRLSPSKDGIELAGYYADNLVDVARQATAISRRDFRNGPHEHIGSLDTVTLGTQDGSALDLLLDGESHTGDASMEFRLVESPVRLVATRE